MNDGNDTGATVLEGTILDDVMMGSEQYRGGFRLMRILLLNAKPMEDRTANEPPTEFIGDADTTRRGYLSIALAQAE